MKLLLDTNFLVDCIRFRIDFFHALSELEDLEGSIEVYVPNFCVQELHKIINTKKVGEAKLVLEMLKNLKFNVLDAEKKGTIDNSLFECAITGYYVASNDRKLLRKLKNNGIRSVRIRDRRVFEIF